MINYLITALIIATFCSIFYGLFLTIKGGKDAGHKSHKMMKARIALQTAALLLLFFVSGAN